MDESFAFIIPPLHTAICLSGNGEKPAPLTVISAMRLGSDIRPSSTRDRFPLSLSHWDFQQMLTVSVHVFCFKHMSLF